LRSASGYFPGLDQSLTDALLPLALRSLIVVEFAEKVLQRFPSGLAQFEVNERREDCGKRDDNQRYRCPDEFKNSFLQSLCKAIGYVSLFYRTVRILDNLLLFNRAARTVSRSVEVYAIN